jgi:hypothetical protein
MATELTLFPKFPLEIREMIWTKAAPDRVITLTEFCHLWSINHLYPAGQAMLECIPLFNSSAVKVPALLHTSQEARRVALRSYHLVFKGYCKNPFYFNPSLDTIFLPFDFDIQAFMVFITICKGMKMIRHLGLGRAIHNGLLMSASYAQHFGRLVNLESLIIQLGHNCGQMEKFQVRKHLKGLWKKADAKEGEEKKFVMQNPDIVFLEPEEMEAMGMVTPNPTHRFRLLKE